MDKKGRKKAAQQNDVADDYKSSHSGYAASESYAPSVYSGQLDYKSTYTADETNSVFSAVTGAELKKPKDKPTRRRRKSLKDDSADYKSTYTADGASSVAPSEYLHGIDPASDYASMYVDDSATVFSKMTGMDASTVYSGKTGTTVPSIAVQQPERKRSLPKTVDTADYKSTFTDGAETAVTGSSGVKAPDYMSAYHDDHATVYSGLTGLTGMTGMGGDSGVPLIDDAASEVHSLYTGQMDDQLSEYQSIYNGGDDGVLSEYPASCIGGNENFDDYGSTYTASPIVPPSMHTAMSVKTQLEKIDHTHKRERIVRVLFFVMLAGVLCFGGVMYLILNATSHKRLTSLLSDLSNELEEIRSAHGRIVIENQRALIIRNRMMAFYTEAQQTFNVLQNRTAYDRQIANSLDNLGGSVDFPTLSCRSLPSYYSSGYYYIRSRVGPPVRTYCDMTISCQGFVGGWARVVDVDMLNESHSCPDEFNERGGGPQFRSCQVENLDGCVETIVSEYGIEYSEVCGTVTGFQIGQTNAFKDQQSASINDPYVDGVSLTYGSPRKHIWTFASARDEGFGTTSFEDRCPCIRGGNLPNTRPPSFVGSDYFCDTAVESNTVVSSRIYTSDLLWNGDGCGSLNQCCTFNRPPLFIKNLHQVTNADIELRICMTPYVAGAQNIAVRRYTIYIS